MKVEAAASVVGVLINVVDAPVLKLEPTDDSVDGVAFGEKNSRGRSHLGQ